MLLSPLLNRFVAKTPISVMTRALMEHALSPADLNALFERTAKRQYTRERVTNTDETPVAVARTVAGAFADLRGKAGFVCISAADPTLRRSPHAWARTAVETGTFIRMWNTVLQRLNPTARNRARQVLASVDMDTAH